MTSLRLLLAGFLGACGLVLLAPMTSHACSCAIVAVSDHASAADAVFTGTLVGSYGDDPVTYRFDVDEVHKGDVAETTEVSSAGMGGACGVEGLRVGSPYVVFADGTQSFSISLCGGTTPASTSVVRKVDRVLGPAEAPRAGSREVGQSSAPGEAMTWVLVGAAGLVAVGLGTLAARRRR